jgi:23S rRNA (guanosine2251-2'-O)-methyltransferase
VAAVLPLIQYHLTEHILPEIFEEGRIPLLLVLDRITDVRNFGAICRSAECAGVNAVIIAEKGSAQVNADAVKTSAGALHRIVLCRERDLKSTLLFLKESGVRLISCTEKAEKNFYECDLTVPAAFILGSEENGVSPEYMKLCDARAKIPLSGEIKSLNVSVAAGIILFEAVRQRLNS